jgi:hypothetical protein
MKALAAAVTAGAFAAALSLAALAGGGGSPQQGGAAEGLKSVANIERAGGNDQDRSLAAYAEMAKVLTHPRCVNCHPKGDVPLQGDAMRPHEPPVIRGADNFGAIGMRCTTCHQEQNVDAARLPGAPRWHLAPIEMAWEGVSVGDICRQIKDKERNGGKSLEELVTHNGDDELVGWGWKPDKGRPPAPGTQKLFGELTAYWVKTGAACPP